MRKTWLLTVSHFALPLALSASITVAVEPSSHRQLDAHVHGHGTLSVAIEDSTVSLELEAPGADIAGFEHEATSTKDKAAIDAALKTLRDGAALFKFTDASGCGLKSAEVKLESEQVAPGGAGHGKEAHDTHGHGKEEHGKKDAAEHDGEARHSAFHATYTFTCTAPAALTAIETQYFATFPAAKELGVAIVAPKGQSQTILSPKSATIALGGMM